MILSQIRDYIRERQLVSMEDLMMHFDVDESALMPMLEVWERKGRIHQRLQTSGCGSSCNQCPSSRTIYYAWGDSAQQNEYLVDVCSIKRV